MTVIHEPVARPTVDEPEVLFREARQRRRRRWLVSGIIGLVLVVIVGLTVGLVSSAGSGDTPKVARAPVPVGSGAHSGVSLSFRPVLCYAPALTLGPGQTGSTGPLPACSPSSELTASNLQVSPNSNSVNGYTSNTAVAADPQFATYPSTTPTQKSSGQTVLLPGTASQGPGRYVLGPAVVTQADVQSASAQLNNGQWAVNLIFTPRGSSEWDTLTLAQFHAVIGVVLNGTVISAPITQPTQSSWTSFNGEAQISGSFTPQQARAIAREL